MFYRIQIFVILFFLLCLPYPSLAKKKTTYNGLVDNTNCEVRGVWVDEIENNAKVNTVINNIVSANLNTVFVVSPPIGPNGGWAPKKQFQKFVQLANRKRLNVHIWIPNLYRKKMVPSRIFALRLKEPPRKNGL